MSPCIHKTVHRFPYPSNCAQQNLNFISQKKYKIIGDLTNKVVTSTLDIVDMQDKIKDVEYIIKKVHGKPINMALNYVTKSLQRIDDMETSSTFRQDDIQSKKK